MKPARSCEWITHLFQGLLGEQPCALGDSGRGQQRANDFDEWEHSHGVEEVDAGDLRWALGGHGQVYDRDGGGVASEHRTE